MPPLSIDGRPPQLSTAIDNLLDNEAKFSPADQPIEVSLENGPGGGRLSVRDHGPGILSGDLPHVFERFHRADSARTLPGSGLGLAIVHDAAIAHGATVTAANHPDGGAVLTIGFGHASANYASANYASANYASS